MRLNRILTGLACMLLLAGIGAAVELFGGSEIMVANGAGGAAGGPYLILDSNNLELGVDAHAWANKGTGTGTTGDASAAFNGSGFVSNFRNLTNPGASVGFLQAVSYSGRVQAKVNKTVASPGTIDAYSLVYAKSNAQGTNDADALAAGQAEIFTSIGRHNDRRFNATGTAAAVARGSASYSTEYINGTTTIKATGEVGGETFLTAENKKNTGGSGNTSGEAGIFTSSSASAIQATGSRSYSELHAQFNASSGLKGSANTITGFVNATKAYGFAWDTNRTSIAPNNTNYNVYSNVAGVLNGDAKAFENKDRANTTASINAEAIHKVTQFDAISSARATTLARRLGDNNTTRVEGSAFINNAAAQSITQGRLGAPTAKKDLTATSSFKTLGSSTPSGAGDNIGGGIFLSNKTSTSGFSTNAAYTQSAKWNNALTRFDLATNFNVVNNGMNFSTNVGDIGAIGTVMTIMNNSNLLSAAYGTTVTSTNMASQKNWNWYASTNGVLNQGGVIDAPTFVVTGTTPIDSQTYIGRQYTRTFATSNPS